MGRLNLLTLRIGLICMRASSPAGFRPGSEVLHALPSGSGDFTRLAGAPTRSGPKNIVSVSRRPGRSVRTTPWLNCLSSAKTSANQLSGLPGSRADRNADRHPPRAAGVRTRAVSVNHQETQFCPSLMSRPGRITRILSFELHPQRTDLHVIRILVLTREAVRSAPNP